LQPNPIRYSLEYAGMIINSTPDIQLRDSALPFPPDREGVILRLGMVLRRMNELARKEIGPDPRAEKEVREQAKRLANSWQALVRQMNANGRMITPESWAGQPD
jgi:hypothetical protein